MSRFGVAFAELEVVVGRSAWIDRAWWAAWIGRSSPVGVRSGLWCGGGWWRPAAWRVVGRGRVRDRDGDDFLGTALGTSGGQPLSTVCRCCGRSLSTPCGLRTVTDRHGSCRCWSDGYPPGFPTGRCLGMNLGTSSGQRFGGRCTVLCIELSTGCGWRGWCRDCSTGWCRAAPRSVSRLRKARPTGDIAVERHAVTGRSAAPMDVGEETHSLWIKSSTVADVSPLW